MKKYLYIHTFGCQMNVHDSEKIRALMTSAGYGETTDMKAAELIILNTCSIREKAAQKAFSQLGRLKALKKKKRGLIVGVAGCLAQQYSDRLVEKMPFVDFVVGTHNIHRIPEIVESVRQTGVPVVETAFHESVESLREVVMPCNGAISAYVTIMQGCDNFCSYCVVPYVRGREESRPFDDVLNEVKLLASRGIKEVTLLGQNVNAYGKTFQGKYGFSDLLYAIGSIRGIERIRFTTSHPKDIPNRLIACFSEIHSLCEHIHLPVQSGSDRILRMMNRGYTSDEYCTIVDKLRKTCPGISITSDVIVGFPGETDRDFKATIALMEKIRFDSVFSFKYSDREQTAASGLGEKISERVKGERLTFLQSLQDTHTLEKNASMVGRVEEIIVEGLSKNSRDDVCGRTRTNKIVNFRGDKSLIGKSVSVKITEAYLHSLRGALL